MTDVGKGRADHLELGDWNAQCYQCGRKRKASSMMKHWQGYWVCPEHWEARHPQDFVRAVPDVVTPPWTQPWPEDSYALNVVNLGEGDNGTWILETGITGKLIINILTGTWITETNLTNGTTQLTDVVINVSGRLDRVVLATTGGGADPEINVQDGGAYSSSLLATGIVLRAWKSGHAGSVLYATIDWDGNLIYSADVSAETYATGYPLASLGENVIVFLSNNIYSITATYALAAGPVSIAGYGCVATWDTSRLLKATQYGPSGGGSPTLVGLSSALAQTSTITASGVVATGGTGFNARPDEWQVAGDTAYIDLGVVSGTPKFASVSLANGATSTITYASGQYTFYADLGGLYLANFCVNEDYLFRVLQHATTVSVEVVSLLTGAVVTTLTVTTALIPDSWYPLGLCCDAENLMIIVYRTAEALVAKTYALPSFAATDITATLLSHSWNTADLFDALPGTRLVPLF